jgi:hypothetical protein
LHHCEHGSILDRVRGCPKFEPFFNNFPSKRQSKIDAKNDVEKIYKIIAKGSLNGTEIDSKTHQKSMPELVSEK